MSELRAADPTRPPPGRPVRGWQVLVAVAGLAMAVAGFGFWLRGAQSPGLAGTWTGSAAQPPAGRVFPVRLDLRAGTGSVMRWGADLHCSGMLGRTRSAFVYELMQVRGDECYRGTLRIFPTKDTNQVIVRVTREHETDVTYSGTLARSA